MAPTDMAANAVQIADHEQSIQILKHQNTKLCEQLSTKKEQIKALEGNVQKFEEEKKKFADTLLCVNRIWQQFTTDISSLCKRNQGAGADADAGADPPADPAAAAEAEEDPDPLVWDSFDPFLARLLQGDAASSRVLKKHTQTYLSELSVVEEALHARAAAGLQALANLLDAIEVRGSCRMRNAFSCHSQWGMYVMLVFVDVSAVGCIGIWVRIRVWPDPCMAKGKHLGGLDGDWLLG